MIFSEAIQYLYDGYKIAHSSWKEGVYAKLIANKPMVVSKEGILPLDLDDKSEAWIILDIPVYRFEDALKHLTQGKSVKLDCTDEYPISSTRWILL